MKKLIRTTAGLLTLLMIAPAAAEETGILDRFRSWIGSGTREEELLPEDITPKRGERSPLPESEKEKEGAKPTAASAAQNWYCPHTTEGIRPVVPPEMQFLEQHDGFFLGADEKVIYLTFDAGYENGNVEKILDVLKAEQVPGAFFILENLAVRNTDLVKRMIAEGHTVCNHTAKHHDMTAVAKEEFAGELAEMERIYREATGAELAKYYRPPEGRFSEQNLIWAKELGYRTVLWSYAYADWDNNKQMSPEKAKEKVLSGTHNGEVLRILPPALSIRGEEIKRPSP